MVLETTAYVGPRPILWLFYIRLVLSAVHGRLNSPHSHCCFRSASARMDFHVSSLDIDQYLQSLSADIRRILSLLLYSDLRLGACYHTPCEYSIMNNYSLSSCCQVAFLRTEDIQGTQSEIRSAARQMTHPLNANNSS